MKKIILLLILIQFNLYSQSILNGTYQCYQLGDKIISDGNGSELKFLVGKVLIRNSNRISINSKIKFTIKNRKPISEIISVNGKGILETKLSSVNEIQGNSKFIANPVKEVKYKNKKLTINTSTKLKAKLGDYNYIFINVLLVTKFGNINLSCNNAQ